jgi:hypothetical protein
LTLLVHEKYQQHLQELLPLSQKYSKTTHYASETKYVVLSIFLMMENFFVNAAAISSSSGSLVTSMKPVGEGNFHMCHHAVILHFTKMFPDQVLRNSSKISYHASFLGSKLGVTSIIFTSEVQASARLLLLILENLKVEAYSGL